MSAFKDGDNDDYAILGLSPGATLAEIKQAFRRLAQQYHPDRNPDNPAAAAKFQKISAAYEALQRTVASELPQAPTSSPRSQPGVDPSTPNPSTSKSSNAQSSDPEATFRSESIPSMPPNPWSFYQRAMAKKKQRDYGGTLAELDRAIAANGNFVEAYLERLQLRFSLLDDRGVLADCQQVLRLNPRSVTAYYWLGRSRQRLGYVDSALSAYSRVIELQPNHASAYYRRGLAHQELAELPQARRDWQRAAALFQQHKDFPRYYRVEAALANLQSSVTSVTQPGEVNWLAWLGWAWLGLALAALPTILVRPGRIGQVFARFTPVQAVVTGVGFAALALGCCFLGLRPQLSAAPLSALLYGVIDLKLLGLVPLVTLVALTAGLRRVGGARQSWAADWFLAGSSLLPAGYLILLPGVRNLGSMLALGLGGNSWLQGLALGAIAHGALIFYNGCTQVLHLPAKQAAIAVPIVLLATGWLTRLVWLNVFPWF